MKLLKYVMNIFLVILFEKKVYVTESDTERIITWLLPFLWKISLYHYLQSNDKELASALHDRKIIAVIYMESLLATTRNYGVVRFHQFAHSLWCYNNNNIATIKAHRSPSRVIKNIRLLVVSRTSSVALSLLLLWK